MKAMGDTGADSHKPAVLAVLVDRSDDGCTNRAGADPVPAVGHLGNGEVGPHQEAISNCCACSKLTRKPEAFLCPPPPYCLAIAETSSPSSVERKLNTRPCGV